MTIDTRETYHILKIVALQEEHHPRDTLCKYFVATSLPYDITTYAKVK